MLSIGSRPERLLVRSLAVRDLLAPLGAGLGAELRRVQRLPALEQAADALKGYFAARS